MKSLRRQDVFLIALAVSVGMHLVIMLWARSQVMTRVTSLRRLPKHVAITMRDAPSLAAPKTIDLFDDEAAKRSAPVADGSVSAPSSDEALPMSVASVAIAVPAAPAIMAKVEVEDLANGLKETKPTMISEQVKVLAPVASRPDFMTYAGSDLVVKVPPPALPAADSSRSAAPSLTTLASAPNEQHIVPKEVLAKVDEKFVESEKAAVWRLLNVDRSLDLTKVVEVKLEKSVAAGWTYFRTTITPKVKLPSVPKDIVILLDASGSIGYDRLASCRKAAKQILRTCTNTGDRFNLVAFRDRYSYAFRSWQECTAASFEAGDEWLSTLTAHGRTDVFESIRSVLTLPREPRRPLIAMVVTDGDANMGVSETKDILSKFTALNGGLISIYMYGVRSSANRELIDVLTHGNRGESFVYDSWKMWNAGEGIEGLSERFRDPLITDLRVVFPSSLRADAYPVALKNLYRGNTVTITGRIPGNPPSLDFSLRGLAGDNAYEGFFRLPFASASVDAKLAETYAVESSLADRLH